LIEPIKQVMPSRETCAKFDARTRAEYDRDRIRELGFNGLHEAVGTLLIKGVPRLKVVEMLEVDESLVTNVTVRLGLQWSKARNKQRNVGPKRKMGEVEDKGDKRRCARCGVMFTRTSARWMLCDK